MIRAGKRNVIGVLIDVVDYEAAVEAIIAAARAGQGSAISALAVHGLMTGVMDSEHRYRLNHFDLLTPDGHPIRWALNILYRARLKDRVYGPDLTLAVCARAEQEGLPVYFYGSTPEVLEKLRNFVKGKFPGLRVAGTEPSKFRRLTVQEKLALTDRIRKSGAAVVFVGLGCPRQEVWAFEFRDALSMPILAVGAAFSFFAGETPQAPVWMRNRGLEWLFRLATEPRRLWRRYVLLNPAYVFLIALQAMGFWRFAQEGRQPTSEMLYG